MSIDFIWTSVPWFNVPTFLIHLVGYGWLIYAIYGMPGKRLIALILALLLIGTRVAVA